MKRKTASPETIDAYIAGFPEDVQEILQRIRAIIRKEAPDAGEAIKYQIPTFVLGGNLVHFAAFKKHIGFYPTPNAIRQFKEALSGYKIATGSIQFPLDSPIPYDLIRKIVLFRVKEVRKQAPAKVSAKSGKKASNSDVDWYFAKAGRWQAPVLLMRKIALDCRLAEVLKWGCPCYTWNNRNIVLIHTFREYCAYLFFKGALLNDPEKILVQQTRNVQAARQARFTDTVSVRKLRPALTRYILQAIELERAGEKVPMKGVQDFPVPHEFLLRLERLPRLRRAFEKLTPGRQKAYLLHFSGAKKSETRESRIEKCIPRILEGIGLND